MSFPKQHDDLKLILHPYVFALKEGDGIKENPLDYTLMMLQVTCPEKIKSPTKQNLSVALSNLMIATAKASAPPR